jgi:hypothetical protein
MPELQLLNCKNEKVAEIAHLANWRMKVVSIVDI